MMLDSQPDRLATDSRPLIVAAAVYHVDAGGDRRRAGTAPGGAGLRLGPVVEARVIALLVATLLRASTGAGLTGRLLDYPMWS